MKKRFLILLTFLFSVSGLQAETLQVLFFGGGGGGPQTGHNGRINHHKLIPDFLRSGIELTYTSDWEDIHPDILRQYDAVVMYRETAQGQKDRVEALVDYVEAGGGLVAIHNTCAGQIHISERFRSLIGGQFARHGSGVFTARHVPGMEDHPALGGIPEFTTWDETYVHKNLTDDRLVLQTRGEKGRDEPWTWVREQGAGRVFYTAYGHDHRAWEKWPFQQMIAAATVWVSGQNPRPATDIPLFTYRQDTAVDLHNFEQRPEPQRIQEQLSPQESAKCLVLPEGFKAELIAHEPDIINPIDVIWDDRGRMYVAETADYPILKERGSDRITLCEDTDGDGHMDQFTVFAEGFSIHTAMCWVNGGIILAAAPDMYFLKDTDGDDRADVIKKINSGWGTEDLHGGPSNLRYGLDNNIYGCVGGGGHWDENGRFSAGLWHMDVDGSNFTPIGRFGDNSWGFSMSEDFELFGSSANRGPAKHVYAPEPYYEAVGLKKVPARAIFDFPTYYPLTITRVADHFGQYTSGAGFDVYTARSFPKNYWNRAAFVGGPTGKLLGQFFLQPDGQGSYVARNSGSLAASFDEYTAPIGGRVGPDGAVYMLDWNNLIMLHGGEITNPLRDKSHGRLYRITHEDGTPSTQPKLHQADTPALVNALRNDNLFWRSMAQQKIVQQIRMDAVPLLIELAKDPGVDEIGLNPGVIHALWTLHGLGQLDGSNAEALEVAQDALKHRSAGVRKNAARVLPLTRESADLLADMLDERDANARRYVFLSLATMPASDELGRRLFDLSKTIEGKSALRGPLDLAIARHGASLVEELITKLPLRDRAAEVEEDARDAEMVNLLQNPSFEEVEDGLPAHWDSKQHNGVVTLSVDSSVARTGQRSGRIESAKGGGGEFNRGLQVKPGEYLLSGWVKTENVEGNNGVLLKVQGSRMQPAESIKLKGTNEDWQKLQINFRVPEEHGVLVFGLFGAWAPATGTAWFDDMALYQLTSEKVAKVEAAAVETVLAKQVFERGAESVIRVTELVNTRSEEATAVFMEGLADVSGISFTEVQTQRLKSLAADAAPHNQFQLAVFASNNGIDLGLSDLLTSIQGFEAVILEGDAARGKDLALACTACHGPDFSGLPELRSPSLSQQSSWTLQTQMQKFKHGLRGGDVADSDAYNMSVLMGNYTHQQMADMAEHIRSFTPKQPVATLGGDPVRGKTLYASCIACHGVDARGNEALKSPSLLGLSDSYIVNQLIKFKDGTRGSGKGDLNGKLMQVSAQVLPDEQAMKDVAAFITTLQPAVQD